MKSSWSSAAARRGPLGADSTGLPAIVISALIWPGAGRVDFLGQAGHRQLAAHFRRAATRARRSGR